MADAIKTKTVLVDGLPVETTDAGAVVIEKLTKDVAQARTALTDAQTEHAKALAAKDAEIDALKGKVLTDADLDKRVAARSALVTTAKAIAPSIVTDGLSDEAIRREAVRIKLGDAVIKDKAPAYVDARFEILAEDAAKAPTGITGHSSQRDPIASVLGDAAGRTPVADAATAHAEMLRHNAEAWKGAQKGAA